MSENPYQAPQAHEPPPVPVESFQTYAEEVRRKHLGQEAQIKSIGSLYQLGGVFSIISIVLALTSSSIQVTPQFVTGMAISALFVPVQFVVAHGLIRFKTWARITALVFAILGLVFFAFLGLSMAFGALICVLMIILLLLKKNKMIFSPEYKAIIAATPHIKRKSSIVYKIALVFLAVILLLVLAGVSTALFGSKM